MDSDRRIFSPAKRSRRCALTLIACSVLMTIAFVAIHKDRLPVSGNGPVVSAPDRPPISTTTDRQSSVPVQVSMAGSIAPRSASQDQ